MQFDVHAAVDAALAQKSEREREREQRSQEEQRARLSAPSDVQAKMEYGRRAVILALDALKQEETDEQYNCLAEGYALQGEYERALEVVKDSYQRESYVQILNALNGAEPCHCPATVQIGKHAINNRFLKERIFARGKIVDLYACTACRRITC